MITGSNWEYSLKSGIALLGVLPNPLKSYTGSTLGEYSRKSGIVLLGVLPQAQNSSNGSTPGRTIIPHIILKFECEFHNSNFR